MFKCQWHNYPPETETQSHEQLQATVWPLYPATTKERATTDHLLSNFIKIGQKSKIKKLINSKSKKLILTFKLPCFGRQVRKSFVFHTKFVFETHIGNSIYNCTFQCNQLF